MDDTDDSEFSSFDFDVFVSLTRPLEASENNQLRRFDGSVIHHGGDDDPGETVIGSVRGWMTWDPESVDLIDHGDEISGDALILGETAQRIVDEYQALGVIKGALLIDRMHLDAAWRGHRLTGPIVDKLLHVFLLDREAGVVVLVPEPLAEGMDSRVSGPLEPGPERDEAMRRLQGAYRTAGFEPRAGESAWWLPFPWLAGDDD